MIIYIEAFSGLSGNMFLGALAEMAGAHDKIKTLPHLLNLPDAKVKISTVEKNGIVCKHVEVIDLNANHYHHHHHHEEHSHHHNNHRHLSDIINIINNSYITDNAKNIAKEIFTIIGESESKIHNIPIEKIHFHEVSGVDSIVDIVGTAYLLDKLSITKTYSTAICTGFGFVDTQHGKLPVPAPATADILSGIPTYAGDENGERVTPTGAAILKYLNPNFEIPTLTTEKTTYGSGKKDFVAPNVLRISSVKESIDETQLIMIECNIDDMSYELLGSDFQEKLLEVGARDFYFTNIQMKKSRPAILLSCLVEVGRIDIVSDFILENTSTIGVKYYKVDRKILKRNILKINTTYGEVRVKIVETPSGKNRKTIEFNDLVKLSKKHNIAMPILQNKIIKEIE
jgi:uncharacterized protein (TIGR00299 family) protein